MQWYPPTISGAAATPGVDKSLGKIAAWIARRRAVKRQKTTFGRDDHFVAAVALGRELLERGADRSFASLTAIVDRAVDDVAARFDGANDRFSVLLVGGVVMIAEISAHADRRHPQALDLVKMFRRNLAVEALPITLRTRRRR